MNFYQQLKSTNLTINLCKKAPVKINNFIQKNLKIINDIDGTAADKQYKVL